MAQFDEILGSVYGECNYLLIVNINYKVDASASLEQHNLQVFILIT